MGDGNDLYITLTDKGRRYIRDRQRLWEEGYDLDDIEHDDDGNGFARDGAVVTLPRTETFSEHVDRRLAKFRAERSEA